MSELNQHIDNAARFQQPPASEAPIVDQSGNMNFALDMAKRMVPTPEPTVTPPLGAMPIPN
jgi:hypothetical protein